MLPWLSPHADARPGPYNRVRIAMAHSCRYGFAGQARLAHDIGVSTATISRILSGKTSPSWPVAHAITDALSLALNRQLALEDLFSPDGAYAEPSGCKLCGCPAGCIPEWAYEPDGSRKPEYAWMKPGDWTLAPLRSNKNS